MVLSIIARVLSAVISVYFFLCVMRVIISWVPQLELGRGGEILKRTVDPYLGFFSRFPSLRSGTFDFSPIVALAILVLAGQILKTLAFAGHISIGVILAMLLGIAWSAVAFVLTFFSVCALIRIIAYAARWNSLHPLWRVVDSFLNPVLYRINRLIYRNRIVNYLQGLITGFVLVVLLQVAGSRLVALLASLLAGLPF
ncbi:MAG TPA: YggT family protein [Rectinemataceae bacterium]|nr:YggT family protein [Rectinemataceae bacterium]